MKEFSATILTMVEEVRRPPNVASFNLGGDFRITNNVQVYARVENLFDEKYEEVITFRTPGRAEYMGVRFSF